MPKYKDFREVWASAQALDPQREYSRDEVQELVGRGFNDRVYQQLAFGQFPLKGKEVVCLLSHVGQQIDGNAEANTARLEAMSARNVGQRGFGPRDEHDMFMFPEEYQPVVVTRHTGAVEWLRRQGIVGRVIAHATPADVQGRNVYGSLPLHLAALATRVMTIDLPDLQPEQRGQDLSPEEMDAAGAKLVAYVVREVK